MIREETKSQRERMIPKEKEIRTRKNRLVATNIDFDILLEHSKLSKVKETFRSFAIIFFTLFRRTQPQKKKEK